MRHGDGYHVQAPELVHLFVHVQCYSKWWTLIPAEELHASSVQHSRYPEWRWVLHSRSIPVIAGDHDSIASGVAQPAAPELLSLSLVMRGSAEGSLPCAGIEDEHGVVLTCWECLADVGAKKPKMPAHAFANDNWLGRERRHVREAS